MHVAGGELSPAGVEIARSRVPDVPVLQLDARRLPFDSEFDVVAACDVLEHVSDDELVLREMERAATSEGGVLITVPQHPWLWGTVDEVAGHIRRYTRRELVAKLQSAGLRVAYVTSFVSLLLPVVSISRLLRRGRAEDYDLRTEFSAPRIVDRLFEQAMWLERQLIERRVSLPVGSSLLAVAKSDRRVASGRR